MQKYRTIKTAKENEIENIEEYVKSDKNYLPSFHIYPKSGLLNDPNGLIFDGEKYHIFYQWYPFDSIHGMKHWKHMTTKDFITFEEEETLIPEKEFESHGCYSGGAIKIDEDILCFYTGNTKQGMNLDRVSYQNIAVYNQGDKKFTDKYIVAKTPNGYTQHFRDPKPWIVNGEIRFICGAQREDESGTAVIFSYDKDKRSSKVIGELEIESFDNENVFMWECPDLFKLDKKDVFIWCPQGIKKDKHKFNNNYSTLYATGELVDNKIQSSYIDQLDYGFDFYAPQTFTDKEDTLLIGWAGIPDAIYPSDKYKWQGMLTIPKVIEIQENKLIQKPHKSIYSLIQKETKDINLSKSYIKSYINNEEFELKLFKNKETFISISYKNNIFTLDRENTKQTEFMKKYGSKRSVEINDFKNIEIFIDNSIIEIFINEGEYVFTSRFFIENKSNEIEMMGDLKIEVYNMKAINL